MPTAFARPEFRGAGIGQNDPREFFFAVRRQYCHGFC